MHPMQAIPPNAKRAPRIPEHEDNGLSISLEWMNATLRGCFFDEPRQIVHTDDKDTFSSSYRARYPSLSL